MGRGAKGRGTGPAGSQTWPPAPAPPPSNPPRPWHSLPLPESQFLHHLHKDNIIFGPAPDGKCAGKYEVISVKTSGEEKCLVIIRGNYDRSLKKNDISQ